MKKFKWVIRLVVWGVLGIVVYDHAKGLSHLRDIEDAENQSTVRQQEAQEFARNFDAEASRKIPYELEFAPLPERTSIVGGGLGLTLLGRYKRPIVIGLGDVERLVTTAERFKPPAEFSLTGASLNGIDEYTVLAAGGYTFGSQTGEAQGRYLIWRLLTDENSGQNLPMLQARAHHAAYDLKGIEAVLIGGESRGCAMAHVERFDYASRKARAAAPMLTARSRYASVQLADGRILVAGGNSDRCLSEDPLDAVEMYDPENDLWIPLPPLEVPRREARALLLGDGRIMVAGGTQVADPWGEPIPLDTVEIWSPEEGRWSQSRPLHFPRLDLLIARAPSDGDSRTRLYRWSWQEDRVSEVGALPEALHPYALSAYHQGIVIYSGAAPDELSRVHLWLPGHELKELPAPEKPLAYVRSIVDPDRGYLGLYGRKTLLVYDMLANNWSDRSGILRGLREADDEGMQPLILADMGGGRLLSRNIYPLSSREYRARGDQRGYIDIATGELKAMEFTLPMRASNVSVPLSDGRLALVGVDFVKGIDYASAHYSGPSFIGSRVIIIPALTESESLSQRWRKFRLTYE